MIEWIIRRSVANRFLVMMAALFLSICENLDYRPHPGGCPAGSL